MSKAHNQLIQDLGQIKAAEKHAAFLRLINEGQYSSALLLGFQDCVAEDLVLTQLLRTLLKYVDQLPMNINQLHDGATLRDLAIKNRNYYLQFYLDKRGVLASDKMVDQWTQAVNDADNRVFNNLKQEFLTELVTLDQSFKTLPAKSQIANNKEDNVRVICIVKHLQHLQKYYSDLHDLSMVKVPLSAFEQDVFYFTRIKTARVYFHRISLIINGLSCEYRANYDHLLEPVGWFMLEQFGGVYNPQVSQTKYLLPIVTQSKSTVSSLVNSEIGGAFFLEFLDKEQLIEDAVPHVLKDVPDLQCLFKNVLTAAVSSKMPLTEKNVLTLTNIRTTTRYFLENQYLIELLNLTSYLDQRFIPTEVKIQRPEQISYAVSSKVEDYRKQVANMSIKQDQHALLGRLKKIGELFTTKKTDFKSLDDSIDVKALITLRDIICHQDEGNNKYLIDSLLQDPEKLQKLVHLELHSLYIRIFNFIKKRQNAFGLYQKGSSEQYIVSVLNSERKPLEPLAEETKIEEKVVAPSAARRVDEESEKAFFVLFDKWASDMGCDDDNGLRTQFQGIFDGSVSIPNKQVIGEVLLKPLSVIKKIDKTDYVAMTTIFNPVVQKKRNTPEERENKREQDRINAQEHANKLKQEKQNKFHGLDTICELARKYELKPMPEHLMTPVRCVDAATEALINLKEFLDKSGYLDASIATLTELDNHHNRLGKPVLSDFLSKQPNLSDALEYNFALILQYLHVLNQIKEVQSSTYLNNKYNSLRSLRNLLEHGDHTGKINNNMEVILPHLIEFINKLEPELFKVKQSITRNASLNAVPTEKSDSPLVALTLFRQESEEDREEEGPALRTKLD